MVGLLLLIAILLATALVLREPELRRRIVATLLRGQGAVRAAFGLFSPRDLQRQALARIKESALVSIGFAHLPTEITVLINPDDASRLGATRAHVTEELARQVVELDGTSAGGGTEFVLGAEPRVKFVEDSKIPPGTVEIESAWLEGTEMVTVLAATEDEEANPSPDSIMLRVFIDDQASSEAVLASRMRIGRAPDCDLKIDHPGVSREHLVIAVDENRTVTVTDCDSRNRVEVVGVGRIQPHTPVPVSSEGVLKLGRHVRIELGQARNRSKRPDGGRGGED